MKTITIIEDDIALNNGIALALKNDNYSFRQLYKLSEYDHEKPCDLIILDINLPDGNGFDFLKKLRKFSDIPVIILTATILKQTRSRAWSLARTITSQNRLALWCFGRG